MGFAYGHLGVTSLLHATPRSQEWLEVLSKLVPEDLNILLCEVRRLLTSSPSLGHFESGEMTCVQGSYKRAGAGCGVNSLFPGHPVAMELTTHWHLNPYELGSEKLCPAPTAPQE